MNNIDSSKEAFIDSLMNEMTLREKIGQMNQYSVGEELTGPAAKSNDRYDRFIDGDVGSVMNLVGSEETYELQKLVVEKSRLGIPLLFALDVIHGYKTIFPVPLAESCSWDLALMEMSTRLAAKEASSAGLHWTFAPMVDISRDPRWGRVMEGAGEDTYLGSLVAEARINGFQGHDLRDLETLAACAKHFAGYGFVESGKEYNTVSIGRNLLHNVVMPPFEAAANSGVATFMNAFNDVDGIPATANEYLLRDILFDRWKFSGVVISDYTSIPELIEHGVAPDTATAAQLALTAGSHIDMEGETYLENLEELVDNGVVSESLIDDAVRRIIELKYDLGLFEDPYRYSNVEREKEVLGASEMTDHALEMARKSIVLLKNEGDLLPLDSQKKIAVIGPLAKDKDSPIGSWRAQGGTNTAVSLYEGLSDQLDSSVELIYAQGCDLSIGQNSFIYDLEIEEEDQSQFDEAIKAAASADVVIMALGETAFMSGEARSRTAIGLPGVQLQLLKAVYEVNPNIVLVLMNGRPLTISWEMENIPAIVEAWHLGSQAGNAIADILLGKENPSGKLTMSFPRSVGQIPIYYNSMNTGRPTNDYVFYSHFSDEESTPLFPFGFGLSYTDFKYSGLKATVLNDEIQVKAKVKNVGNRTGEEITQLYIRDTYATISRPIKELKGFSKNLIEPGMSIDVEFRLKKEDLSFYHTNKDEFVFEPGEFEIMVGTNSSDLLSTKVKFE